MTLNSWAQDHDVIAIYFHGSRAEDVARPDSDADVAVLLACPPTDWEARQQLTEQLADLLSPQLGVSASRVDVQILNEAPPAFQFRAVSPHRILWEADDSRRAHFETRLYSEYLDYRYYEDIHHQARLNRIREGHFGDRPILSGPATAGA